MDSRKKIIKSAIQNKKISRKHIELSIHSYKNDLDHIHCKYNNLTSYLNHIFIGSVFFEIGFSLIAMVIFVFWSSLGRGGFICYIIFIGLICFIFLYGISSIFTPNFYSELNNEIENDGTLTGFLLGIFCVVAPIIFFIIKELKSGYRLELDYILNLTILSITISIITLGTLYLVKLVIIDVFIRIYVIVKIKITKNNINIRNKIISYGVKEKMLGEQENVISELEFRDNKVIKDLLRSFQFILPLIVVTIISLCVLSQIIQSTSIWQAYFK